MGAILENLEDPAEAEREVNVWMETEKHNCVLDAHSAAIKCVVINFAVTERDDERAQKRLAANVAATANKLAAHFVTEPAFVKYKESIPQK